MTFLVVLGLGAILHLPDWSNNIAVNGLVHLLVTGGLTVLLVIPFSLVACVTRGYLPAVGCMFLVLVLAQVCSTLGYGQFFPWAIPALYNGLTAEDSASPGLVSYLVVILVGVISSFVTALWWEYADQA